MRWFKHMSDAADDEDMELLMADYGLEGYARWWLLLESIAKQMDKSDKCSVAYSWGKWQTILRGKRNKLETFLKRLENKSKIKLKENGNILEIECRKLLKLRDEYTKKSGHSQDSPPDEVPPKNTEADTNIKTDKSPSDEGPNLWDLWLSIPGVKPEKIARPHLGKLIRQYGETVVAQAVAVTAMKKPAEPHGFLEGQLKANPVLGKRPDWAILPDDNNKLWDHAKKYKLSNPGQLNYRDYRKLLQTEIDRRLKQ
jgi:hypothetical protein